MIEARGAEILSLNEQCKTKLPKLHSQRLPRFMRRRQASHNPKRLPKSVQLSGARKSEEIASSKKKNKKKYKNKNKVQKSIEKRIDKPDRTILHFWFAKRFKLKSIWGCQIPIHNCTKNQRNLYKRANNNSVFYYIPFWSCLEFDYSSSNKQNLVDLLSKFTNEQVGFSFGAKIFDQNDIQGNGVLFKPNHYPYQVIGPVDFMWNSQLNKLWLWTHISVYDSLFDEITKFNNEPEIKISKKKNCLERFRVIGPLSLKTISKLIKFDLNDIQSISTPNSLTYIQQKDNSVELIQPEQSFVWTSNGQDDDDEQNSIIICNNNNRYNNKYCVDLITTTNSAKSTWYQLTENRNYLAGGYRDLKSLCLYTSSLMFPDVGFADSKANDSIYKKVEEIMKFNVQTSSSFYVMRNEQVINSLSNNFSASKIEEIFSSNPDAKNSLVNVEMICLRRGHPQDLDYIFIPTADDITNFIQQLDCLHSTEESFHGPVESDKSSKNFTLQNSIREVIGLAEIGGYSLESACGKAIGVISLVGLLKLTKISESLSDHQRKGRIYGLIRSIKSPNYYLVYIKILNSIYSV